MDERNKKEESMGKEEFRELAKDMKPIIKDMEDVLKKHGVECLASLCMSTDGYFSFDIHNSKWEYKRSNSNAKSVIYMYESEEV